MTRPLLFVDTETTGLDQHARAWEVAVVRRDPNGTESVLVAHIADAVTPTASGHALTIGGYAERCGVNPLDNDPRPPLREAPLRQRPQDVYTFGNEREVAPLIWPTLAMDEPLLIGVGIHYDAAILGALFVRQGLPWQPWHYGILDLKAATWGAMALRANCGVGEQHEVDAAALPMRSEQLAAALGVEPPTEQDRHTALGDARWAARWFDTLTGAQS